jgi:hypothetical protein
MKATSFARQYSKHVRCRCRRRACQKRVTLRKRPEQYVKAPVCAACGGPLRVDPYRQSKRERRKVRCYCGARPWKHTKGSYCKAWAEKQAMYTTFEPVMADSEWAELAA